MAQNRGGTSKGTTAPALLEWVAGGVGAVIVLTMMAVMASEALTTRPGIPPLMHVEPAALRAASGGFVLEVKVVNRSHQTAAAVEIEGELTHAGSTVETSSATLTYVPGNSEGEAGLVFTTDPRQHQLRLRVMGYEKP